MVEAGANIFAVQRELDRAILQVHIVADDVACSHIIACIDASCGCGIQTCPKRAPARNWNLLAGEADGLAVKGPREDVVTNTSAVERIAARAVQRPAGADGELGRRGLRVVDVCLEEPARR